MRASSDSNSLSISIAFWVGYGYSFWNTGNGIDLEWRLSNAMQFVPAILFLTGVPFIPERYVLCAVSIAHLI